MLPAIFMLLVICFVLLLLGRQQSQSTEKSRTEKFHSRMKPYALLELTSEEDVPKLERPKSADEELKSVQVVDKKNNHAIVKINPQSAVEVSTELKTVPSSNIDTDVPKIVDPSKKFIYLIQTEQCIKPPMRSEAVLGSATACSCDVLILSYRQMCTDTSLPHVQYIFNVSVTWTAGRSQLYLTAKKRNIQYLYYILLDDDANMHWIGREPMQAASIWRAYEKFLLDIEPPLVALDNTDWSLISKVFAQRQRSQCTMNGTAPKYFQTRWFDAEMNAFHYKAVEHVFEPIIPYWNRYDKSSWWLSQWYVNFMTDIVYHGQAVINGQIILRNTIHRNYPKGIHNLEVLKGVADDIRLVIPSKHHEGMEILLKRWIPAYVQILSTIGDTFCQPLPIPHQDFIPFKTLPKA